jgi:hypothetical protein
VQGDVIAERAQPSAARQEAHAGHATTEDEQRRAGDPEGYDDQQRPA